MPLVFGYHRSASFYVDAHTTLTTFSRWEWLILNYTNDTHTHAHIHYRFVPCGRDPVAFHWLEINRSEILCMPDSGCQHSHEHIHNGIESVFYPCGKSFAVCKIGVHNTIARKRRRGRHTENDDSGKQAKRNALMMMSIRRMSFECL